MPEKNRQPVSVLCPQLQFHLMADMSNGHKSCTVDSFKVDTSLRLTRGSLRNYYSDGNENITKQ